MTSNRMKTSSKLADRRNMAIRSSRELSMVTCRLNRLLRGARRLVFVGLTLAMLLPAASALAGKLDDLRTAGAIGERYDGFLEVRDPGAADAKKLVEQVNAKRRKLYEKRAKENKATPEQVGQIYAKKIMEDAPAGTWFKRRNGKWARQ